MCEFITTIIIAVITLLVAIITCKVNNDSKKIANRMEKRDIDRYNKEIDAKAREFISKYNKRTNQFDRVEINNIDLCIIAYMFNPIHSYKNQMYLDFNNLSDDIKNKILEIRHSKLTIKSIDNFYKYYYDKMLILAQKYPEIYSLVKNDSDYILDETYLQNDIIDNQYEYCRLVSDSFKNNEFSKIINIFKDKTISQNTLRFILCLITQEITKYSIDESDKDYFVSIWSTPNLDYFNNKVNLEDLFLHTLLTWYLCIEIIGINKKGS